MISFNKRLHKIAIIAPSSSCYQADDKLEKAITLLKLHGFDCKYYDNIFEKNNKKLPFFASSYTNRLQQFKDALLDEEVKVIWAFRGGYGASEIVFDLMSVKPSSDKILIGFSDITTLHLLFHQHYGIKSIHGSVLTSLLNKQHLMLPKIIDILAGKESKIDLKPLYDNNNKSIRAKIVGGNLTMICNMIGTKLHPNIQGKILFLEDVHEKGYHIHRHLLHMYNSGVFNRVKAVIFGNFTDSDALKNVVIMEFAHKYLANIPTFETEYIGHEAQNYPITIGSDAEIIDNSLIIRNDNNFELI